MLTHRQRALPFNHLFLLEHSDATTGTGAEADSAVRDEEDAGAANHRRTLHPPICIYHNLATTVPAGDVGGVVDGGHAPPATTTDADSGYRQIVVDDDVIRSGAAVLENATGDRRTVRRPRSTVEIQLTRLVQSVEVLSKDMASLLALKSDMASLKRSVALKSDIASLKRSVAKSDRKMKLFAEKSDRMMKSITK